MGIRVLYMLFRSLALSLRVYGFRADCLGVFEACRVVIGGFQKASYGPVLHRLYRCFVAVCGFNAKASRV